MSETLELARELITMASVTPEDGGCQPLIAARLEHHGFSSRMMRYDEVDNIWISHGQGEPVFAFLGHTDVVPPGPVDTWDSDPFRPEVRDGYLYGRGAADMKGSIAAMVLALESYVREHPNHPGTIGLLLTSDEEGDAIHGIRQVMEQFEQEQFKIKWCLVGEPSSSEQLGDMLRCGRRGSLHGHLTVNGVQGHVAIPEKADNPIHRASAALTELCARQWDTGNDYYPATSFQISNIHAGTGADNVIPGELQVLFNFRFCTESTEEGLKQQVHDILDRHRLDYALNWRLSGQPFLTGSGQLLGATRTAIREVCGLDTVLSTGGGTSDGRFVAPTGAEVIELGPSNASIHKVNECVRVSDLDQLTIIYEKILQLLFDKN